MSKDHENKFWMDATGGIREEYIEEAAFCGYRRRIWIRVLSAAAVLALVIGMVAIWHNSGEKTELLPMFAIRTYAAEGETVILENTGDTVSLLSGMSELFAGRKVFILDVSLEGYDQVKKGKIEENFSLVHRGASRLKSGESDEYLSVQWLDREKDGMFGYRLIGWCEKQDTIALQICGDDGTILHEKELRIEATEEGYQLSVDISYHYQSNRSTEDLIDVVMRQKYTRSILLSSNFDMRFLLGHTGFQELIRRPDAPSKILELFLRSQNGEILYPLEDIFFDMSGCNDGLLNVLLTWDEIWERLTPREQALALGHGCHRLSLDTESRRFGEEFGHLLQIPAPLTADENSILEVSYNGITTTQENDRVRFFPTIGTDEAGNEMYGWMVCVCVEDQMVLTFTVRDQEGRVLQQEKYLAKYIQAGDGFHWEMEKLTS